MFRAENGVYVVAIDHGYSTVKTVDMVRDNGVTNCVAKPAVLDQMLYWNGKYYKVFEGHLDFAKSNVGSDSLYVSTLAMLGHIAKTIGVHEMKVILGVGLPFSRHGAEKKTFKDYLCQNSVVHFEYEEWALSLVIEDVYVFPQGFAAAYGRLEEIGRDSYVVDIGSRTFDCVHIKQGLPIEADSFSQQDGIRKVYQEIKDSIFSATGKVMPDERIDEMIYMNEANVPEECKHIVLEKLRKFAEHIEGLLREHNIDLELNNVTYVGGGAQIMKKYASCTGENIRFWCDVKENAKGYERALRVKLNKGDRKW
ncbi:MAG: ParM/StbA family protein [Butyribacter sp.]|nr:ParM/StbA family protein [bacterium]MDY3854500.1 ParM/StbA family protein [Butyribacter sp.]